MLDALPRDMARLLKTRGRPMHRKPHPTGAPDHSIEFNV